MLNICESEGFLHALYIILRAINIVKILVPIILIVMMSFDIFKVISDTDAVKKVKGIVIKRLLAALLIFFVPTIINLVLTSLGNSNDISTCYNNAKPSSIFER